MNEKPTAFTITRGFMAPFHTLMKRITACVLTGVLLTLSPTEADAAKRYRVGSCQVQQRDLPENLYPFSTARSYIYKYQRHNPAFKSIDLEIFDRDAKASLVSRPKLGKIEVSSERLGDRWDYVPTKFNQDGTYAGRDHFVVRVDYKDVAVFIHYYIEVIGNDPPTYIEGNQRKAHFCKTESWKISKSSEALIADDSALVRTAGMKTLTSVVSSAPSGWQSPQDAA